MTGTHLKTQQGCHTSSSIPGLDLWSLSPIEGLSIWSTSDQGVDLQHWQCAAIRAWGMSRPRSILSSILDLQVICHEQNLFGLLPCNRTSHWHLGLDIILITWRWSLDSRWPAHHCNSLGYNSVTPSSWPLYLARVQGQLPLCSGEQCLCVPASTLCL